MAFSDEQVSALLVKAKALNEKDSTIFLQQAQEARTSLADLLISQKRFTAEEFHKQIAQGLGVNYVDIANTAIDQNALMLLPEIVAKKQQAVVFARDKNGIHVALADPTDTAFIKNFEKRIGDHIIVYFADPKSIAQTLQSSHRPDNETFTQLIQEVVDRGFEHARAEDVPIINIVQQLLVLAYRNNASDIHIEPFEDKVIIRFRIDGILHDIAVIPKSIQELIVTRIKILSRVRTDEHHAAQDGKLRFDATDDTVDVRVSIVPVVYGEKIVMRLLSEKAQEYDLEKLGFRNEDLQKILTYIKRPWGMILACGPTGSGKTTTLYAILKKLNKREVNISTIEDPVEYDMEGINQIQVNPKTNLTFAAGLRSIVRQDPDIIMVGEIRDEETAKIAVNSAMTGHLVLSTLHTNDAATTLPRLLDMGVQPFLVASTVNVVIAQRLVRKICTACAYQIALTPEAIETIGRELSPALINKYKLDDKSTMVTYGKGCDACQSTGYQGRIGIYEVFEMTDDLKTLIMEHANATTLKEKAVSEGMLPMIEDGILKILSGVTTMEELLRVTQE